MALIYHVGLGYCDTFDSLCYKFHRTLDCKIGSWVNYLSFYVIRLTLKLLLRAAESGYIPGIMFLLSKVYKPQEFSFRVSILLTMATLSGLLSGPLTYAMSYFDGKNGMHDWQYLFIFEGVPTILLSGVSYFFLFDDLQKVKWLSVDQKLLQASRMENHHIESNSPISWNTLKIVLVDWKTWAFAIVFLLNSINVTSLTVFSPVLINSNFCGNIKD